jgi:hypothetical protein
MDTLDDVTLEDENYEGEYQEEEEQEEQEEQEERTDDKRKQRFKKLAKDYNDLKAKVGDGDIETIVQDKINQSRITEKLDHVKSQLPDDLKEKFEEEFADLTNGREITTETVDKFIKSTLAIVSPEAPDLNIPAIG